jgi:hypothetical protein
LPTRELCAESAEHGIELALMQRQKPGGISQASALCSNPRQQ